MFFFLDFCKFFKAFILFYFTGACVGGLIMATADRHCVFCNITRSLNGTHISGTLDLVRSSSDAAIVCMTTAAEAEDVNISMPFHICWNTSNVISCVITREEYTYRPEPVVTGLSRDTSLAR